MCQPFAGECQICEEPWSGLALLADLAWRSPFPRQTPPQKVNKRLGALCVFWTLGHKWEVARLAKGSVQKAKASESAATSEPGASLSGGHVQGGDCALRSPQCARFMHLCWIPTLVLGEFGVA